MSAAGAGEAAEEHRVTPLELFFDLVIVLAFTQVTALMAEASSWTGLAQGMLVLAALWWAWVGYAWLTNVIDPQEGWPRIVVFVAMAALLVVALAVPEAFGDEGLLFAVAYGVVRVAHLVLQGLAPTSSSVRAGTLALAPSVVAAVGLLVAASQLDGTPQGGCWALALAIDFGGALRGIGRWRVGIAHFAERHGLIVIIALGESIVALGVGAGEVELDAGVVVAACLGVATSAALWWMYFDVVAVVAERVVASRPTQLERNAAARDNYSYLHLLLIAGVVLLALGVESTLAHVDEPLKGPKAAALVGGPALYLSGMVLMRLRNTRSLSTRRAATVLVLVALFPLATSIDALPALALVCAVCVALVAYEAIRYAERRDAVRHAGAGSLRVGGDVTVAPGRGQ